ncbi:uncharacterized protein LOC135705448 [Ochlerotatus camptorhynchus]|uniref:uncharacterized protein LOC135705448 n=1 Tax=Ochlerotatus camptorhynchus TaxID=644619 RepID=UPI0031D4AE2F
MSKMAHLVAILLIVTTALHVVQPQAVGTDCNGKTFLCLDTQSFQTCSQSSSGQTQTFDTTVNACPVNQLCSNADSSACSSSTTTQAGTTTSTTAQPSTTSQPMTTTTESPFTCEKSGRFPHESECHEFYLCLWYPFGIVKIESTCLFGMVFDPTTQRCAQDQTKCQLQQPSFTCTSAGKFPDPSDSTRYFLCRWNGTRYELLKKTCWLGFTFNADQSKCNGFIGF